MATPCEPNPKDSYNWLELYATLRPLVKKQIYNAGLQSWTGQEYDLCEDAVQETVVRMFIQTRKAECGAAQPVLSTLYFGKRVAKNYVHDMIRKEWRLIRPTCDAALLEKMMMEHWIDSTDAVLDDIEKTSLFMLIAHVIAKLPTKRQTVLLIDLAMRTPEGEPPGPLQQALASKNIHLEMYRALSPTTLADKKRHAALLTLAYQRVGQEVRDFLQTSGGDYSA